ncbi:DUF2752 domain-containing protein [Pedobacter namyangjuensis]|uniref:DUF2752 domain-containing protein n=1 Tax=Pedobacter namyangjuensis TaxID=600626 RepID=UPI000DE1BF59
MKAKLAIVLLIVLTEGSGFIHWLEHHLLTCPFKASTGIDCPGCGLQRSFVQLIQGNFTASFKFYPPTIFIVVLLIFTAVHLKFDFKNGAFIIKMLYIAITITIVANYIYKILNNQLI